MNIQKNVKRLAIYFLNDAQGVFDSSQQYLLKKLHPFFEKVVFVYQHPMDETSKKNASQFSDTLLHLSSGYKQNAYKLGFETVDYRAYDEIVFLNSEIIGPFYELSDMFEKMGTLDLDFWGLYEVNAHKSTTNEFIYYGKKREFLIEHYMPLDFFVVRCSLFASSHFQKFFSGIKITKTQGKLDAKTDLIALQTFEDLGYHYASVMDTKDLADYCADPLLDSPLLCIEQKCAPFLYAKTFYRDLSDTLQYTLGQDTKQTVAFIDQKTNYAIDRLYDHVLRVGNQHDIKNCLGLTFTLPRDYDIPKTVDTKESIALGMHLYYEDLFEYCLNYAKSMPKNTHVYITIDSHDKKQKIEEMFKDLECEKLEVRVIGNRGRDVSALLIGLKDILRSYDIICFVHDKKTTQFNPSIIGETFSYQCFENTLASKHFVNNVIQTFMQNKRLGILSPTVPFHGQMFSSIGRDWTLNYENTIALAKQFNITSNIQVSKPPVAPLGTMFWLRGNALAMLIDDNITYENYPKEPNGTNGTLLHAYERLYPYAAQHSGYFVGQVMVDSYAQLQINAHYHMLRKLGYQLFSNFDLDCDNFNAMIHYLNTTVDYIPKQSLYKRFKLFLYMNLNQGIVKKIQQIKRILSLKKD